MNHPILSKLLVVLTVIFFLKTSGYGEFVHPGITHKRSDLDRVKYMVEARIDPWFSSYQEMVADSKSSYSYKVKGDPSFKEIGRDNKVNYRAWKSDIRAAYYNAIRWYVSGDERHAAKAVEIFNAWRGIETVSSNGTVALSGGVGYIMIEAAEIIKSTYSGWKEKDIQAFKDMLVFPGYSNTVEPDGISNSYGSFYWQSYQGDSGRHGNQGLSGWRTVMAMGIFLDNEIMYDRALRYIKGLHHRVDDLPYPAGPPVRKKVLNSTKYVDTYKVSKGRSSQDYIFNEALKYYIWDSGQCQESSRDQHHVLFGLGLIQSMAEMAWNQGEDLYSYDNDRLLKGLEYAMRYNVSKIASYPDQPNHWIPTVESGEFMKGFDRTGRWFTKAISPVGVGSFPGKRPLFEASVGHYLGRGLKSKSEAKWVLRARDVSLKKYGLEKAGWTNDAIGWGSLTARRPDFCYGEPVVSFNPKGNIPEHGIPVLPGIIEAENFDYTPVGAEGRTYHDSDSLNLGGEYRKGEAVDLQVCSEGGYHVGGINDGEWLTYTVYVPTTGRYDILARYAATDSTGGIKFVFCNKDKGLETILPSTDGIQSWSTYKIAEDVLLGKGVQCMKIQFSGSPNSLNLNYIKVVSSSK